MASLSALPIFEVDLPENIALKRAKLQELYGEVPGSVCLVPLDFEHQDLAAVLAEHGYRADQRTFFVWEGVTQYLTEAGVRKTFDFLAKAASGSRLVFTYVRQDFIDGVNLYGAERAYRQFRVKQEVWHFGLVPERIGDFLAEYRWREVEQLGSQECVERYIRPAGRDLAVSELERLVYAERL
jgi:methyltransferase (TIGR00027 family)